MLKNFFNRNKDGEGDPRDLQYLDTDPLYIEREPTQPAFTSQADIDGAKSRFHTEHDVHVARKLIALGYGPLGVEEPNYNPVFRRRYYLTISDLHAALDYLHDHYDSIFTEENMPQLDYFCQDVRWWLLNREDIFIGSKSRDSRRFVGIPNTTRAHK